MLFYVRIAGSGLMKHEINLLESRKQNVFLIAQDSFQSKLWLTLKKNRDQVYKEKYQRFYCLGENYFSVDNFLSDWESWAVDSL